MELEMVSAQMLVLEVLHNAQTVTGKVR